MSKDKKFILIIGLSFMTVGLQVTCIHVVFATTPGVDYSTAPRYTQKSNESSLVTKILA